jgi:hypothetical protein
MEGRLERPQAVVNRTDASNNLWQPATKNESMIVNPPHVLTKVTKLHQQLGPKDIWRKLGTYRLPTCQVPIMELARLLIPTVWVLAAAAGSSAAAAARSPGCATRCGDIDVPYPFGLDPQCAINAVFQLNCSTVGRDIKLFHGTLEVIRFSVPDGKAWLKTWISRQCYDQATGDMDYNNAWMNISNLPYVLSASDNKVIVLGCRALAYMLSDAVTAIICLDVHALR